MKKFIGSVLVLSGISFFPYAEARSEEFSSDAARWGSLGAEDTVSVDELRKSQMAKEDLLILDARGRGSFDAGHIEGAALALPPEYYKQDELFRKGMLAVPPDSHAALVEAMKKVPRSKKIVTYCSAGCSAAATLLVELKEFGFKNVKDMEEGYQAWQAKGYPVSPRSSAPSPAAEGLTVKMSGDALPRDVDINEAVKNAKRI